MIENDSMATAKTRVLLICVLNKSGTLITHDVFYRLFSQ